MRRGPYLIRAVCNPEDGMARFNVEVARGFTSGDATHAATYQTDPLTGRELKFRPLYETGLRVCASGDEGGDGPTPAPTPSAEDMCRLLGGTFFSGTCTLASGGNLRYVAFNDPDANGDGTGEDPKIPMNGDQGGVKTCSARVYDKPCNRARPFARDSAGRPKFYTSGTYVGRPVPSSRTCYFREILCPTNYNAKQIAKYCVTEGGQLYKKFPDKRKYRDAGVAGRAMRGWTRGKHWCYRGVEYTTEAPFVDPADNNDEPTESIEDEE